MPRWAKNTQSLVIMQDDKREIVLSLFFIIKIIFINIS